MVIGDFPEEHPASSDDETSEHDVICLTSTTQADHVENYQVSSDCFNENPGLNIEQSNNLDNGIG
jgi:hypothetical protein